MTRPAPGPRDEELIRVLRAEEAAAREYQESTLSEVRTQANDRYDRKPYGDEQLAGSKVVTSEFFDSVEAIMPGQMEVFAGSDQVVRFAPGSEGQEQYAEEATDYVTHCIMQKNNGFVVLHDAIKDGMMSRLGGCAVDVEEYEDTKTRHVEHMPEDALNLLRAELEKDGGLLTEELSEDPPMPALPPPGVAIPLPPGADPAAMMPLPPMAPPKFYSGTIAVTRKLQRVVIDGLPAEDILFSPTAHDQDRSSFLGYFKRSTASELIKLGLSQEEVDELHSDRPQTVEEAQRTEGTVTGGAEQRDRKGDSERPLWLVVGYVKFDDNGDGVSETLRVVYAHGGGNNAELIEKQPWKDLPAVALATPILMPHVIVGRSLYDQTEDLQRIGTALTRGMLENMYQVNRPRPVVSDKVNLDTLISWIPGSPIRLMQGSKPNEGHIEFLKVPSVMGDTLPLIEYFATVRENRTGTSRANQGLQADSLNKTKGGLQMLMSAGAARQKLMARVLAETFVARLYRIVYQAIKRSSKGPVKYWAGTAFKQVDPSKWPDVMDLTVNVGAAAGNVQQELEQLMLMAGVQEKLVALQGGKAEGPFVYRENIATLAQKIAEKLGYKTPGMFFAPREKVMAQPAQPQGQQQDSPEMAAANGLIAVERAKAEAEIAIKREKNVADIELEREKARARMAIAREEAALTLALEREKARLKAGVDDADSQRKADLKLLEIATDAARPPALPNGSMTQ